MSVKAKRQFVSIERLRQVCAKALLEGYGEMIPYTTWTGAPELDARGHPRLMQAVQADLSQGCEKPVWTETVARFSSRHIGSVQDPSEKAGILAFFARVQCRKCAICMVSRSRFWGGRAFDEYQASARTIMGTFTMSPEKHQEFDYRLQLGESGVRPPRDLVAMTDVERFVARADIFGDEVTRWIDLIRKGQKLPLAGGHWKPKVRYLLIAEAHDSETTSDVMKGRPHFHILLHEQEAGALIGGDVAQALEKGRSYEWERYYKKNKYGQWEPRLRASNDAWLKSKWTHGHTSFDLCLTANSAVYVCKYLSKAMMMRVRASQCYGGSGGNK